MLFVVVWLFLLSSGVFFKINFSKKFFQEHYQSGLDPDRTDILSVLIWAQTVCKGYQQMTKFVTSKKNALGILYSP